jgi:hypothetical protein
MEGSQRVHAIYRDWYFSSTILLHYPTNRESVDV